MRLLDYIFLIIILLGIIYYFLFPNNIITKGETQYIKGDTVTVTKLATRNDTINHYIYIAKADTVRDTLTDTLYLSFWSHFNLGDSLLGTSGKVSFNFKDFKFDSIKYRYPEKLKIVTDTLKFKELIQEPFYLDEWFYSSVALLVLLVASLGGG